MDKQTNKDVIAKGFTQHESGYDEVLDFVLSNIKADEDGDLLRSSASRNPQHGWRRRGVAQRDQDCGRGPGRPEWRRQVVR